MEDDEEMMGLDSLLIWLENELDDLSWSWTALAAAASCGEAKETLDEDDEEDEDEENDEDGEVLCSRLEDEGGGSGGGLELTIEAIVAAVAAALDWFRRFISDKRFECWRRLST